MNGFSRYSWMFLLSLSLTAGDAGESWKEITAKDLRYVHEAMKEGHPGMSDPNFSSGWVEKGYQQAQEMLDQVNSASGHRALLDYYLGGFKDGHIRLAGEEAQAEWPGFVPEYRNGCFCIPGRGRIIKIGNQTPEDRMRQILEFTREQVDDRGAWAAYAPYLLIDEGNPWIKKPHAILTNRDCIQLRWRPLQSKDRRSVLAVTRIIRPERIGTAPFGNNGLWVTVGTFRPNDEKERAQLERVVDTLKDGYRFNTIVFDLRGNSGGNLAWGIDMLKALYGREFKVPWGTRIRISPQRITFLNNAIEYFQSLYGPDYWIVEMLEREKKEIQEGQEWIVREAPDRWIGDPSDEHPSFHGKVYVVTDWRVGSSGHRMVDILKRLPNVTHLGAPFGRSETPFTEPVDLDLPSGLYQFRVPTKVVDGLLKESQQSYDPDIPFPGDIRDTNALKRWVLKLQRSCPCRG